MRTSEVLAPPAELLDVLRTGESFVIGTHRGPDGDALGSALGLCHALRDAGKSARVVASTIPGDHYLWLPGADELTHELAAPPPLAILVDCDSPSRLDHLEPVFMAAPQVLQIDHHSGPPCGHVQFVDTHAAATCCLVWRLLQALQWPVTTRIATCLYTGLVTDTGFFRFENTNPEVLGIASQLVALGAEPFRIAEAVSEARPVRRLQLAGRALASLQTAAEGRIVYSLLHPADYAATGCNAADTESIVDLLKQAEGQEVCVLLKRVREGGKWQVSLRSRLVDVADVARTYGGGGHARAAGFDYEGDLDCLQESLLRALSEALDRAEGTE